MERPYRIAPAAARRRGLPGIGLEMTAPESVELTPVATGPSVIRCCERREDGAPIGELEVTVFRAALVIDRDGILEERARAVAEQTARVASLVPVELPGASGFRADVTPRGGTALPYVHVFAVAPKDLGVDGGVIVTVRSAKPEWPAADAILGSLRLFTRGAQNDR